MIYQFDADCASDVGVDGAIILQNIMFWIAKNEANNKHFYEGRYWTYNSAEAFVKMFPFWNRQKIDRLVRSLEDDGWLISGNFNDTKYDRTKWYAISEKSIAQKWSIHCSKMSNGLLKSEQPIPDSNPDSKPDQKPDKERFAEIDKAAEIKSGENKEPPPTPSSCKELKTRDFAEFWAAYPRKVGRAAALKAWLGVKHLPDLGVLIADVKARVDRGGWTESNKQYIPHASTYLRGERWTDEIIAPRSKPVFNQSSGSSERSSLL